MRRLSLLSASIFAFASACVSAPPPAPPPDEHAAAEASIRAADEAWARTAAGNSLETWMSYYTADVVVLGPNEPTAVGTEAARKSIGTFLATPGLKVSWAPRKVEGAKSGEIGYSYGTYELTFKDEKGKPGSDKGKYLEVWKKQPDGSWKCAADMFSSDLPAPPVK